MHPVIRIGIKEVLISRHRLGDAMYFALFAVLMLLLFHFTGALESDAPLPVVIGLWWAVMTMTVFLLASQLWTSDNHQGIWDYHALENISMESVVAVKMMVLTLMLEILGLCLFGVWMVFYPSLAQVWSNFILAWVLTLPCLVCWVGLAASLCLQSAQSKVILLLILLPWLVPVLIASHALVLVGLEPVSYIAKPTLIQMLVGFLLVSVVLSVWGSAASLRLSVAENEKP